MTSNPSHQKKIQEKLKEYRCPNYAFAGESPWCEQEIKFILGLLEAQRQGYIKVLRKKIKWDVGTVEYTNPDGTKHRVYNADHIDKLIEQGEEE